MLQITEVHRETADSILDCAVDTPSPGWSASGYAIHLNGWVLGREDACTSVEVVYRDAVLRTVTLVARPDIAAIPAYSHIPWAGRSGFSTGVGTLGLAEVFEIDVRAVMPNGERCAIATLRGTRTKLVTRARPTLRPLMVTCLGRSGTTLLMELLGGHPSIVVHPTHPYETRLASYWMQMTKVAGEPGPTLPPVTWTDHLTSLDAVRSVPFIGYLPTEEMKWMTSEYTERVAGFCVSALGDFYAESARIVGKHEVVAFAEKQYPGLLADVLSELCPAQTEIVSIRDPRDMLLSILAFLDSGHTVLSHTIGASPRALVDRFSHELRLLSDRAERHDTIAVKYEDLVDDQSATLKRVLESAGISSSDAQVRHMQSTSRAQRESFQQHRTSQSLEASVGRWQREPSRLHPIWTSELEELTVRLGYPATSDLA